jgi:hypothetical protein
MDYNSTPLIRYSEINVEDTDLIDDAWGFNSEFHDVLRVLDTLKTEPDPHVTDRLIRMITGKP